MTASINKTVALPATTILLVSSFAAVYTNELSLFFAPLILLLIVCLVQYPQLLFYTLIASIPWSAEINFTDSLGTDLPDEPLMLLAALTAIILWVFKWRALRLVGRIHPLLFLLFTGFCWMIVTVVVSSYPLFSIKYFLAKAWYILAFVGAPLLIGTDKKVIRNSAVTLLVSMFTATVVILYRHGLLGFSFASVNSALRPFFRNHVNYSALLVLMVPLQIVFIRQTKNKTLWWALIVSLFVVTVAVYLSYSRGAWLAFFIGVSGFWLIKKGWLFRTFLACIFLLVIVVAWLRYNDNYLQFAPDHNTTIFHQDFSEHLAATYKGKDVSTAERFYRWAAGVNMAGERWFTGFGPTTFYPTYKSYTIPLFRTWVSDNKEHSTVHNYFLLLLIEQGVPGLLLFLVLVGAMFWYAQKIYSQTNDVFWKTATAGVGAILLMQCTLNFLSDLIETDKVGSVFYLCVAVLVMAARSQRLGDRSQNSGDRSQE